MDAVERVAAIVIEIEGARTERVIRTASREADMRPALHHLGRRRPIRPFGLPLDLGFTRPPKGLITHSHAVADGFAIGLDPIEIFLLGIDDDCAGLLASRVVDLVALEG